MDAKKRIDKILTAVHEQVAEEIGVLLGVGFSLEGAHNDLVTKEEFFENLAGKQIVAKVELTGELEGSGCLAIGIKDAIRLGGTLIMLPDSELEEVVGREEYTGETEDSYGEIANIIAGAYTKTFEEMYSKTFRFIRKTQQVVIPLKVDVGSDEPVPDQPYYRVSCGMKLEGRQMGELHMLLPAVPFELQPPQAKPAAAVDETPPSPPVPESGQPTGQPEPAAEPAAPETEPETVVPTAAVPPQAPQAATGPTRKTVDPEKQKKRVDKLLEQCEKKLSDDLSALLGVEVTLSGIENRLISKEDLFVDELQRKQVIADMEVTGELQGKSFFLVDLKDAIQLGGILIMLPPTELEHVVASEDFGDDSRDAFGEVANIVSGVYTSVFEEQYPEKIRFVKKGLQQAIPMKVEIDSDEPIPNQLYYMSSMAVRADGDTLGRVRMIFPAAMFQLDHQADPVVPAAAAVSSEKSHQPEPAAAPAPPMEMPVAAGSGPKFDVEKHRKRVDKLLKECCRKMQEEVAALLGAEITLDDLENRHISKEDFFFEVASGKQVITNLDVVGELEGTSYLFVSLKDAIHLGGVLIMLPPSELESVVVDEEFGDDSRDAYGEIANIISGVYTAIFEEQYTAKIRFVKNELGIVVPMKVDVESDEPIPDVEYYLSSMALKVEGQSKGRIHLMFPAAMLMLDAARAATAAAAEAEASAGRAASAGRPVAADDGRPGRVATAGHVPVDILVISDDEAESARFSAVAESRGFAIRQVSFKDNIKNAITQELKAVYLVMREVNEQAFGMAIKVSSSCSLPLIAAGPDWTRSKVIKAVKYGVNDILLTPASAEDIQENLENNLVQMAA